MSRDNLGCKWEENMKRIFAIILISVFLTPYGVAAQTYSLSPANTTISFRIKNMGIMNVEGSFLMFKGTVDIDATDIAKSRTDVDIETSSINTGIKQRDHHLRSSDFFDVVKFPVMKFTSTSLEKSGANKLKLIGNLTIKGITKQVVLMVESPAAGAAGNPGDFVRAATASVIINRRDFGISYGSVIGDEVFITINTRLNKE